MPAIRGDLPMTDIVTMLTLARSVAIIGASDDGAKPSGRTQRYLRRYGFTGPVYPINPTRSTVQGERAYRSLDDVPEVPDLAVIVLAAGGVEQAVRECGAKGVGLAIVFASGYAEVPDGIDRQQSLRETARIAGVRIIGPNCVGAVVAPSLAAAFMSGLDQDRFELADDGVAFVSQSGAMGAFILNMAQSNGLGVGLFVSTGNEMDVTVSEVIRELASHPDTRVVLAYVEGIRDGDVFVEALREADRRDVPVCLIKVGTSERGAAAAASHTGSLAGADAVYEGVFQRYGVQRAETVEELMDFGRIFAFDRRPTGNRVTIVTLSGGAGALMTDNAEDLDLDIFRWDDEWAATMAAGLPDFAAVRNPIDATGIIAVDDESLRHSLAVAVANPATDVVVLVLGNLDGQEARVCDVIIGVAATTAKPIVVTWVGGSGEAPRLLGAAHIPTYSDPRRAMRAIAALVRHTHRRHGTDPETVVAAMVPVIPASLDEVSAGRLLAEAGVPVVAERSVTDGAAAVLAARELGYPVAVKLLSTEVGHKSDMGGVALDLRSDDDVLGAVGRIADGARAHGVGDVRFVVQQMVSGGPEVILGSRWDPVFGAVTMVGTGGVHAEVLDDIAVRPSPVTPDEAAAMVAGLRGVTLLRGARGQVRVDERSLAEVIAAFSRLSAALGASVDAIEINPMRFTATGMPVAVDVLLQPAR